MLDFQQLDETERQKVIAKAHTVLKEKQVNKRKNTLAQIKKLTASINVEVEILDSPKSAQSVTKVPAKYRHPQNPEQVWTGRGIKPRWLKELLAQGKKLDDFFNKHQEAGVPVFLNLSVVSPKRMV